MRDENRFEVLFLPLAEKFVRGLDDGVRLKVLYNLERSRRLNDQRMFKKISPVLWEFRIRTAVGQIRLLAFFDTSKKSSTLVIATHGFVKKDKRLRKHEIRKAERIRKAYFER